MTGRTPARPLILLFTLFTLVLGAGCEERRERTISREAFVTAMVDLRREAARTPLESRTDQEIDQALAEHDLTRDELRTFVEVHGDNVPMMTEIWDEIDRRVHAGANGEPGDVPNPAEPPMEDPADPLNGATNGASGT